MRYNIIQRGNISVIGFTIFFSLVFVCGAWAQDTISTQDHLNIVGSIQAYRETIKSDSNQQMIGLKKAIPGLVLDLRYAGPNNFMKRTMYNDRPDYTFLRLPAVRALQKVQQALGVSGYGIKVYDAYRPYAVTEKFWELVHDDRYVADPKKGSGHNRGIAVDLTIIDLKTGKEIAMPTGFDNFSDSAHQDFMDLPGDVLRNRTLLKETMEKFGFKAFQTEWWHYSLPDAERFPVLNVRFRDLKNARKD